jgi:hypothetical protein
VLRCLLCFGSSDNEFRSFFSFCHFDAEPLWQKCTTGAATSKCIATRNEHAGEFLPDRTAVHPRRECVLLYEKVHRFFICLK